MKDGKVYEEFEVEFQLKSNSREELRKITVNKFLSEKPGYWKDGIKHVTRYKYFVENLSDGRKVYLLRPTYLNKGIDFQVWVEKMDGTEDKRPSHGHIFNDLILKKGENPHKFQALMVAVDKVWRCEEPDNVIASLNKEFERGFSVELLLKILKWLFIEQDITYWNYDGRGMLKMTIDRKVRD